MENSPMEYVTTPNPALHKAGELQKQLDDMQLQLTKLEILLSALISVHPDKALILMKAKADLAR